MGNRLLNPEGLPWAVGIGLPLTILLVLFTGGTFALLLGAYLAYWLYVSHRRGRSLFAYGLLIGLCSMNLLPSRILPEPVWASIDVLEFAVWVAAEFILRHEIISSYREHEGYELTIRPVWTFLFGSLYLNYCIPPYTPRELT